MNEQELEQQKVKQQREDQLQQLKTMETWGDAHGEDLAQRKQEFSSNVIAYQTQYDQAIIEQMRAHAPHVDVNAVAPVPQPPVQAPAAQEGYKARREREKKRKEARKICPVGDEYTMDMAREINQSNACRHLCQTPELVEMAHATHSDMRALKVFCNDFKLDKKGQPATEEDEQIMLDNQKFMSDYASGNAELRKPHLDRITQQMLSIHLTPDMFSPENMVKHAAEYKHLGDMFTYIENTQKENPDYFDALPQLQKDLLRSQTTVGVAFTSALAQHMNARGIDFNHGEVYSSMEPIEIGQAMREPLTQQYQQSLNLSHEQEKNAFHQESERQAAAYHAEMKESYAQQDETLKAQFGVSFPGGASELQYNDMKTYREMIADHPKEYGENKELIDKVFSDLYKLLSQLGELSTFTRARQTVVDENNDPYGRDLIKRKLATAALDANETDMNRLTSLSHYGSELMDVMQHILRGKTLLPSAAAVMARYQAPIAPTDGGEG